MSGHRKIRFSLKIPARRYLRYYEGTVKWIQVKAFDGTRVRFPASVLRQFVTQDGIEGTFEITVDENNKLIRIEKLGMG